MNLRTPLKLGYLEDPYPNFDQLFLHMKATDTKLLVLWIPTHKQVRVIVHGWGLARFITESLHHFVNSIVDSESGSNEVFHVYFSRFSAQHTIRIFRHLFQEHPGFELTLLDSAINKLSEPIACYAPNRQHALTLLGYHPEYEAIVFPEMLVNDSSAPFCLVLRSSEYLLPVQELLGNSEKVTVGLYIYLPLSGSVESILEALVQAGFQIGY